MPLSSYKKTKRKAWNIPGLLSLCVLCLVSLPALAQSDADNRLQRLENEMQTLSRAVYRGEKPPPGVFAADAQASAATEIRIQQLEMELQNLRGMIEEQNHQIRQLTSKLDKTVNDMQMQISDMQKAPPAPAQPQGTLWNATPGNASAPVSAAQESEAALVSGEPANIYDTAFSFLKNNQYDQAAKGFEAFLSQYPEHPLVPNAQYWLGETYYVRGQYDKASRIFAEAYRKFPKGPKAPDNLLKLGMSLSGAGNKDDACVAFQQLKADFPTGATPVLRRAEQEMSNLGCS